MNLNSYQRHKWQNSILRRYFKFSFAISEFFRGASKSKKSRSLLSDSQLTNYEKFIQKTLVNNSYFLKFRRKYSCRQIIETVEPSTGQAYLEKILALNPTFKVNMNTFKKNDLIGKPLTYNYPSIGSISPTTLRYVSVAAELQSLFGSLDNFKIAEIGCGYGGQLRILDSLYNIDEYYLYDLDGVQALASKYLAFFDIRTKIIVTQGLPNEVITFDLVISNYAFSEIPKFLQADYIQKVILKSKRGYLTMNTGKKNSTGRSDGKYSLEELSDLIPNLRIFPETPLTGLDNYLLVWNSEKS